MPIVEYLHPLPHELLSQVLALHEQAWPGHGTNASRVLHDPALDPLAMLLLDEHGRLLASLDILRTTISHRGRSYRAGGLSTVVTRRDVRGRGLGGQLVATARLRMATLNVDIGIFTCDVPLVSFYEAAGWQRLAGSVLVGGTREAPFPSDAPGLDKATMADFFSETAKRHQADFLDARIGLYSGTIDALW